MTDVYDNPEDVMIKYLQQATDKYLFVSKPHPLIHISLHIN